VGTIATWGLLEANVMPAGAGIGQSFGAEPVAPA